MTQTEANCDSMKGERGEEPQKMMMRTWVMSPIHSSSVFGAQHTRSTHWLFSIRLRRRLLSASNPIHACPSFGPPFIPFFSHCEEKRVVIFAVDNHHPRRTSTDPAGISSSTYYFAVKHNLVVESRTCSR